MNNKVVVVLGMHRSGTSTVALVLQELGIDMGERLLGASSGNPYGHAEDEDFLDLNELLLKEAKGSWDFPPKQIKLKRVFEKHKGKIKSLLDNKNLKEVWGWKEPRTTLFSKDYYELLDNPYYICVERDDLEVAQSLKKRNRMPIKKGVQLSKRYKNELNNFLQSCNPNQVLHINFSDLHNLNHDMVSQLVNYLDIQPSQEQIKNARGIIKPLNDVRDNREKLKRNENRSNYRKGFKHPIKAIRYIFKEGWRLLKYHLGV